MSENWEEIAKTISELNCLGRINSIEKINIGFNSAIYRVNDEFIIKICKKEEKETGIKQEITFYQQSENDFHPTLIASDVTKKDIPYVYLVEESINGVNLFDVWGNLSKTEQRNILEQLLYIMKTLHKDKHDTSEATKRLFASYDENLIKAVAGNVFAKNQIVYLRDLKNYFQQYFFDAQTSYIHGDIHFNNLVLEKGKIKLIDFENYQIFPIDKEFDTINRMVRSPESYRQNGNVGIVLSEDYSMIMQYFKENYQEICAAPHFEERLLIYDCLNSLKWVKSFPEHEPYHEILFSKSKQLIR